MAKAKVTSAANQKGVVGKSTTVYNLGGQPCHKRQENSDLVNQKFSVTRPNEIWASDITYFKVKGYAVYLCVIIDLFSRIVIGYRVSRKCSTHLVTATFNHAFRVRGKPTELTFHSDRGGQYTSDTFF